MSSLPTNTPHVRIGTDAPAAGHRHTLFQARAAFRAGDIDAAEGWLERAGATPTAAKDPDYLNLLGVLHECRGRERDARRAYGGAIFADSDHVAAQQNMRRLFELRTFGRTREVVALGDEAAPVERRGPRTADRANTL